MPDKEVLWSKGESWRYFGVREHLERQIDKLIQKLRNIKYDLWASLVAQLVKNPPAMQETWVRFLGWEDPLEKGWATRCSILGLPLWLIW